MKSNASAFAALDAQIARLGDLRELTRAAAPDAAREVERTLKEQIAAGTDAEGKAWPRNEDGSQPLQTAAKSLTVVPVGATVFCRLTGHIARHHRGIARGGVERAIFPAKGIPPRMAARIRAVLARRFEATMGGQ